MTIGSRTNEVSLSWFKRDGSIVVHYFCNVVISSFFSTLFGCWVWSDVLWELWVKQIHLILLWEYGGLLCLRILDTAEMLAGNCVVVTSRQNIFDAPCQYQFVEYWFSRIEETLWIFIDLYPFFDFLFVIVL